MIVIIISIKWVYSWPARRICNHCSPLLKTIREIMISWSMLLLLLLSPKPRYLCSGSNLIQLPSNYNCWYRGMKGLIWTLKVQRKWWWSSSSSRLKRTGWLINLVGGRGEIVNAMRNRLVKIRCSTSNLTMRYKTD